MRKACRGGWMPGMIQLTRPWPTLTWMSGFLWMDANIGIESSSLCDTPSVTVAATMPE
jgi:hypothetical protein